MATTSRYAGAAGTIPETPSTTRTTTTAPTTTKQTQAESSTGSNWENTAQQNMTPEALAQLTNLITALQGGGTPEQKASEARRRQVQALTEQLLGTVSSERAFSDAEKMMALNLQQAMEKNMPAIQKAIEGAGTSASSMQGILSQQTARDAALASGAVGGQMAAQYAGQRSSLAGTLEALTRPTNDVTNSLINALQVSKGAVTNVQKTGGSSASGTRSTVTQNPGAVVTETMQPLDAVAGTKTPTLDEALAGSYFSTNTNSFWNPQQTSLANWLTNPSI